MSMNVGDSTDLIHGGLVCRGGGLGVFWRSRTAFEKKLLVALMVVILVAIGLLVAVIVLATQNAQNSKHIKTHSTVDPITVTSFALGEFSLTNDLEYESEPEKNKGTFLQYVPEQQKQEETVTHNLSKGQTQHEVVPPPVGKQNQNETFLIHGSEEQ